MEQRRCFICERPMQQCPDGEWECVERCTRSITVTATPEWIDRQERQAAMRRLTELLETVQAELADIELCAEASVCFFLWLQSLPPDKPPPSLDELKVKMLELQHGVARPDGEG